MIEGRDLLSQSKHTNDKDTNDKDFLNFTFLIFLHIFGRCVIIKGNKWVVIVCRE